MPDRELLQKVMQREIGVGDASHIHMLGNALAPGCPREKKGNRCQEPKADSALDTAVSHAIVDAAAKHVGTEICAALRAPLLQPCKAAL
jgi:hypothetical protein